MTPPEAPKRPVIPNTSQRDTIIAILVGIAILAFVAVGIIMLGREPGRPSANQLTGTIVAKHARGEREQEIRVGRKGLASEETDTGYSFEIHVEKDGRSYDVPVSKQLFDTRKVGDQQSFIRPPSEQK